MTGRVVLLAPDPARFRAGAPWITIASWADAFATAFGRAEIVTPGGTFDAAQARELAFARASAPAVAKRRGEVLVAAETAVKDVRSWRHARHVARDVDSLVPPGPDPVLVWQYHHLFQTAGFRIAAGAGAPVALFVDAPIVWEARRWGVRRPGWGGLLERRGERPQLVAADAVCAVSDEVADAVRRIGVRSERVLITPNAADPEQFTQSGDDARSELGIEDAIVVGWVGSFRPFHDLDLLLDAFAAAQRNEPRLALLVVGDGPRRAAFVERASSLGLERVVSVGQVPHADVPRYVRSMDIAAVPARGVSFHYSPLKLQEYLAAARATVVPRVGELARTMRDNESCLLYEPGDVAGFAAAINRLAAEPELRARLGAAGRKSAVEGDGMVGPVVELAGKLGLAGLVDAQAGLA